MSGHSKWSQIKHKKAATDTKKGQLFSKLVKEIIIAAKTGGASVEGNSVLRATVERARAAGVSKDNIEHAIEKIAGEKEGSELESFLFEASAVGGVMILIEGITDNINRTVQEVKHLISKQNAKFAEPNSLAWNFEKVGVIEFSAPENSSKTHEDIEMTIIDSGARDFSLVDHTYRVVMDFKDTESVRKSLEAVGITIRESGHDYQAKNTIAVEDTEALERLLDVLVDHEDVQEVYTNLE